LGFSVFLCEKMALPKSLSLERVFSRLAEALNRPAQSGCLENKAIYAVFASL
jgi:hypothetical protein